MDRIKNPYSPGAGSPPPELVGRDSILEQAQILIGRIKSKRSEKSMLLTGLRGVGKTVLLNEIARLARNEGCRTIFIEAQDDKSLGLMIAPRLKNLLFELDRMAGLGNKVKKGLAVLKSFMSAFQLSVHEVTFGLDIEPEKGAADSGDIEIDLPNLFLAVGEAAEDRKCVVAILIDEIQYFNQKELGALIMAMHTIQQHQLPIILLGAGLPILPGLAGNSKSYAERLFSFPIIGALSEKDASKALTEPALAEGVIFESSALQEIYRLTKGYPYFLQEWGYQAWNNALTSPITLETIHYSTPKVISRLDENFFRVRFDRLTPSEKRFLYAMAYLGPDAHRTSAIANFLKVKIGSLGPLRSRLINKGMIYSPAYGDVTFTVPLFDEFILRTIPELINC